MTNRDLIEKLQQFDLEDEVFVLSVDDKQLDFALDFEIINVENTAFNSRRVIDLVILRAN